jgi:hypothetical protein
LTVTAGRMQAEARPAGCTTGRHRLVLPADRQAGFGCSPPGRTRSTLPAGPTWCSRRATGPVIHHLTTGCPLHALPLPTAVNPGLCSSAHPTLGGGAPRANGRAAQHGSPRPLAWPATELPYTLHSRLDAVSVTPAPPRTFARRSTRKAAACSVTKSPRRPCSNAGRTLRCQLTLG